MRTLLGGGRHGATLKAAALALSMAMWFFLIHEAAPANESFNISIETMGIPEGLTLRTLEPSKVRVDVSAPRRAFYFVQDSDLKLTVRLFDARLGEQMLPLAASDLELPEGLKFEKFYPESIQVSVMRGESAPAVRDVEE